MPIHLMLLMLGIAYGHTKIGAAKHTMVQMLMHWRVSIAIQI
ncbi:hypothetical protein N879_05645 [Alcaligenes sp. EGD-AK7]|nr:hypothetical protein N879_05645 [Alcaligenes sp. EGD-AK7]